MYLIVHENNQRSEFKVLTHVHGYHEDAMATMRSYKNILKDGDSLILCESLERISIMKTK